LYAARVRNLLPQEAKFPDFSIPKSAFSTYLCRPKSVFADSLSAGDPEPVEGTKVDTVRWDKSNLLTSCPKFEISDNENKR
jgi:hypothetical protein